MAYHTLNREAIANTIGALGSAANLDFTNVIGDSNDLPVSSAVRDAIDEAISSVYKPSGSKAVSELTSALLVSSNKGNVYNMSTNGTTTSDFVEGAGKEINIGDNVVIVEVSQGVYKFDLLAGMVDLTNYYTRTDTDGLLNNKVDKVTGKQLSTEDYTTAEKTKLSSIEDGAEVNIIEDVKVNGTSQQVTNKSVDLSIPSALSDLTDDSTHRVVTDTEKITWDGKSVVTANPTTTSSDPNLNSLGINGTNYNIQGGGGGGVTPSHVGQIIHSTTLDTLAKVQAIYGSNTTWISLDGYVLRGATSGVTPNNNVKDLGNDTHTITSAEMPSHYHGIPALSGSTGYVSHDHAHYTTLRRANTGGGRSDWGLVGAGAHGGNPLLHSDSGATAVNFWSSGITQNHYHSVSTNASNTDNTGSGTAMSLIPNEKNVYMWERTA